MSPSLSSLLLAVPPSRILHLSASRRRTCLSSTEPVVSDHHLEQPNSTTISTPPVNVLRSPFRPDRTFPTAEKLNKHVNQSLAQVHSRLTLEQRSAFIQYLNHCNCWFCLPCTRPLYQVPLSTPLDDPYRYFGQSPPPNPTLPSRIWRTRIVS
jgi:hypothetical protein